jgi:hypothetical protein
VRNAVTALVLLLVATVGACHLIYPSYTHRYRLTLEVEADGQVRTGSGVVEVTWLRQPEFGQAPSWRSEVRGQAVMVDLERHGALLAALVGPRPEDLRGDAADFLALRAFAGSTPDLPPVRDARVQGYRLERDTLAALGRLAGRRAPLAVHAMPQLVWLPDPGNPSSARPVPPADLAGVIGADFRLCGAWIEITRDRVTTGLFAQLPWLAARYHAEKKYGFTSPSDYPQFGCTRSAPSIMSMRRDQPRHITMLPGGRSCDRAR